MIGEDNNRMTELNSLDIDAFNVVIGTIKSNNRHYTETTAECIILLYKILKHNDYTRTGAINSISQALKSIRISKQDIELILGDVK